MTEDVVSRVLDLVRAAAGPDAQAEVSVTRTESGLTRFANSFIHQNVAEAGIRIDLRLHLAGRTSEGSTSRLDGDGLRALVDRAVAAAALLPPDPRWAGLTPPSPINGAENTDKATAEAAPADRAERVRAFVNHAEGLLAAGFCRTALVTRTFANTAGQLAQGGYTCAAMDGVARAVSHGMGPSDGVARASSFRLDDIDGAILGARAAAKARATGDAVDLPPGRYEVVLEPLAVTDLLTSIGALGFSAKAVAENRSFVQLGEEQFDPSISIADDATRPGTTAMPFDVEGTPRQRVTLVEGGRACAITHDRRTAHAAGTRSTGHGVSGGAVFGPMPLNLEIAPAAHTGGPATEVDGPMVDSDVEQLVAGVDRGLLVTDFWYTRVLDPRPLIVTGLTRNGLWLIEDGAVTKAITNLRFTQAYPEALAPGQVLGIGRHAVPVGAGWNAEYLVRAPALRLAAWNFTGGAAG